MRAPLVLVVAVAAAVALGAGAVARGQGIDLPAVGPRAVGRAGAVVVAGDDASALGYNPAGMARRGGTRLQLGLSFADRSCTYEADQERLVVNAATPPIVEDRSGVDELPWLGGQRALGDRVVVGVALLQPTLLSFASATPPSYHEVYKDEWFQYPQRYAATRLRLERRGLAAGVAVRVLPWLAVGASALAQEVTLDEDRTIWGGRAGEMGAASPDRYDMALVLRGRDRFVPGAVVGVLVAPEDAPVELAASVAASAAADLEAAVVLAPSRGPDSWSPFVLADHAAGAAGRLTLAQPLTARAGARVLWSRFAGELDASFTRLYEPDPTWSVTGVSMVRDEVATPLASVPLAAALRSSYDLRGAIEADVVPGFLTVTAGLAYSERFVPRASLSTALPGLAAYTFALGAEARAAGATVILGIARSEWLAVRVARDETGVAVVAPLAPAPPGPVGGGRYDGAATLVAVGVEIEL